MVGKNTNNPNQQSLLDFNQQTGSVMARDLDAPLPPEPVIEPMDGPAVDIVERADRLTDALTTFGRMAQRRGLVAASETPYRQKIEERYGDATKQVVDGAMGMHENLRGDAKRSFSQAWGQGKVTHSGYVTAEEARSSAREDYEKFEGTYGYDRVARDGLKKTLKRQKHVYQTKPKV